MKIITISRQFGSGGRELGKRLADILGFDYYDREIITAISQSKGMAEGNGNVLPRMVVQGSFNISLIHSL